MEEISSRENFGYAMTGFQAANQIKSLVHNAPPMVYLWPKNSDDNAFEEILTRLENVYDFIPVRKKANLIVLKPVQKEAVFFESTLMKGLPIVSPIQLLLDLHGLSRGPFIIEQLSEYWTAHGIDYEI